MSLATVKKGLRQLPYLEMTALAGEVQLALSTTLDKPQIAAALAQLPTELEDTLEADQKILAKTFSRKLAITIQPAEIKGWWHIKMASGPTIRTNNIRDGMMELLETMVAYKALEK